jgi:V8-like Glu-specific endopeptidase
VTVLTAGHCVSDGKGTWASNWMFVPGYNNGAEPHGRWTAYNLYTFNAWHNGGNFGRDVAFGIVSPRQGRSISATVGTVGVTNCGMGNRVKALGYPVAKYGGQKMVQADNAISQRDTRQSPATNGIVTDMTGGCSGGPWFSGSNACGVNSYLYQGRAMIYSPVFDSAVVNLRNDALRK